MRLLKQKKILKKEFLRALERGDEMIGEAERAADRIIAEAREEAGRIRRRAEEEGLEQGKAEAAGIISSVKIEKEKRLACLEKEIVDLAVETASKIVARCREMDPRIVSDVYRKALAPFESAGKIVLRVSPDDYEAARTCVEGGEDGRDLRGRVEIVKDEGVSAGGCLVESEIGSVDGRIETQIEAVRRAFHGKARGEGGAGKK